MRPFRRGDAVITPEGRLGLSSGQDRSGDVEVQFGADGPFAVFAAKSLR